MKSLVQFLIGFMLIYQLLSLAKCKVIKQRSMHKREISDSLGYEKPSEESALFDISHASQMGLYETSINFTNATRSNASDIDSSAHQM
jgi:hypothetical protein